MRTLHFAERTKFALMPVAGGLYAQDPDMLDEWQILWRVKDAFEEAQERKRKAEADASRHKRR